MVHPFFQVLLACAVTVLAILLGLMCVSVAVDARLLAKLHKAWLLTHIADEAAAVVMAQSPNSPLMNLSVLVVQQVLAATGHDITDAKAIERAATAALVRRGVKPGA